MKTVKKIGAFVTSACLWLLCILAIVILLSNALGVKLYSIRSGSMEPSMHTGALAIVYEKADFYDIEVGDVVAFKLVNGELVTHRVEDISKIDGITYFMTKGDANEVSDGYTTNIQNFYGKTVKSIPVAGYIQDWIFSKQGKFMMFGIIGLIFLINHMCEDKENEDKKKKKMLAADCEYEEIVQYIEIDEFGNEIILSEEISTINNNEVKILVANTEEQSDGVAPPILVIEENGVEIECVGEENKHEDNPPADAINEDCTAFEDTTLNEEEEVILNEENHVEVSTDVEVEEEPVKEDYVEPPILVVDDEETSIDDSLSSDTVSVVKNDTSPDNADEFILPVFDE